MRNDIWKIFPLFTPATAQLYDWRRRKEVCPKKMPQTYDEIAPHYDAAIRPFERWFLAKLRASTFQRLPADARVLEVGAGTGLNFI